MSRKTKMYKRSHIRDRKRQEPKNPDKPTHKQLLLITLEKLSQEVAISDRI